MKWMKNTLCKVVFLLTVFTTNSYGVEITYKQILENPTDLELNINYAKQQEKAGNLKLTIATLERLSMLYPGNTDIKLYLLSILINMDSMVKVDLMVRTMLNDPNTSNETRETVAKLLSKTKETEKESKWFAYLDLEYIQTEQDNISGVTKTKTLLQEGNIIPYTQVDSKLVVEYDKTYTRGSALTIGRQFEDNSSMLMNLGLDVNTNNKKKTGDSDVLSGSLSYFKILGDHYISPYIYYSSPNYRKQEDYHSRGLGINNTFIVNEKNNFNYTLGYSQTTYDTSNSFANAGDNNSEAYSSSIKHNYNFTKKNKLGTKLILGRTEAKKEYDTYDSLGLNLVYSQILPFGTLKLNGTVLQNHYNEVESFVSSTINRKDESRVSSISLEGQLTQIMPFLKEKVDKNSSLFYNLNYKYSDVKSTIVNHAVARDYFTIGITKRINLNR